MVGYSDERLRRVTSRLSSGGEDRPGQQKMAHAVADAVADESVVFVEAGTGTGKSLAYLTPIVDSGRRAVIATATIALQEQLVAHDVPAVAAGLGRPVDVVLLKGRSNYLCQQRFAEFRASTRTEQLQLLRGRNDSENVEHIAEWAARTETGDKEELDPAPPTDVWRAVSVSSEECPGAARCPSGGDCFSEKVRNAAAEASIIVTNHHYYGLNIAAGNALLPEHDVVVFDEGHNLVDVVGATNGIELGGGRFRSVARAVRAVSTDEVVQARIEQAAGTFEDYFRSFVGERIELDSDATQLLFGGRETIDKVLAMLRKTDAKPGSDAAAKIERLRLAATRLIADIDRVVEADDTSVLWVGGITETPRLMLTPLQVGDVLNERLWGERSVVVTSATLADQSVIQLGLDVKANPVLRVESPFDYGQQALLYCPAHLPEPRSDAYRSAAVEEMVGLLEAAGGRALLLFTSFAAMDETYERLESRLDVPFLKQGDAARNVLLGQFKQDTASVLLATLSFWQGVDIPGPSLSLVVIDRLPFARPDDPVHQARRDAAGRNAFGLVDLPRVQTLLAQGVGRLIRQRSDRGVVAVLDSRLANKKAYRWDLIRSLPDFRRTRKATDAYELLKSLS